METIDELIKRILRDIEKLKNASGEVPQIIDEIYYFEELFTLTDSIPAATGYDDRIAVIDTAQINRDEVE